MKFVTLKYLCKNDDNVGMSIVTLPDKDIAAYEEKLSEAYDEIMKEYICEYDCDRLNALEFVKVKEKEIKKDA